ncbi:hypothetical protein [Solidesulfovibrio sp.]
MSIRQAAKFGNVDAGGEASKDKASITIVALMAYVMAGDKEKFLGAGKDSTSPCLLVLKLLHKVIEEITAKRHG